MLVNGNMLVPVKLNKIKHEKTITNKYIYSSINRQHKVRICVISITSRCCIVTLPMCVAVVVVVDDGNDDDVVGLTYQKKEEINSLC